MIDSTSRPPLRPEIDVSWRRSTVSGVSPEQSPDPPVNEDLGNREALLRAALPIFEAAAEQLADSGIALMLTDSDSRIIALADGGRRVGKHLAGIGAVRGSMMGEDVVGTTALGTPVETRAPLTVHGAEHFLDAYKHLSCYGRPIVHPTTQRLEGTLCMTAVGDRAHPLFQPMVGRFAADIQARLLDAAHASHRLVLEAFHSASRRRGAAVIALGDDLLLTNTTATDVLDAADIGALRAVTYDPSGVIPSSMTLSSGRDVYVTGQRIAGTRMAAVFVLQPRSARRERIPRGTGAQPQELFAADSFQAGVAGAGRCLVVLGEPGTGRTTRALSAVGEAPVCRVDVAARLIDDTGAAGGAPGLAETAASAAASGAVLVVDGFELLADRELAVLHQLVATRQLPVVLTGPPPDALRPRAAAVSALCDEQVITTPLRQQPQQISALAHHFLQQHLAGGRLGAGVVDALLACEWPANLTELDRTMAGAAARAAARGVKQLDVADLPPRYRGTGRAASLTVLERMERQGIIDALAACHGNKVHAAKRLGISRSTLYVRLRALGISG